jgi:prevent-host-death family protein
MMYTRGMTEKQADLSGVVEVPVTEARSRFAEIVDEVVTEDQFVYLTRRGKRVAVIMPADVGENYERIEDEYWSRRADEARSRLASGDEELIPFDKVIADVEGSEGNI